MSVGQSIPTSTVPSVRPSGSGRSSSFNAGICDEKLDILRQCLRWIPAFRATVCNNGHYYTHNNERFTS